MNRQEAAQELSKSGFFRHWMSREQRHALSYMIMGEEGDHFAEVLTELKARIEAMPKTYETERIAAHDKIVHLHYFKGGVDSWIVEKDMGDGADLLQLQAYGRQRLFGPGDEGEWGYISIQDLIDNGVELDLHWTPKPMSACLSND